jgi:hypothetical protein
MMLVLLIEHLQERGVATRTPNQLLDRHTFDDGSGPLALRATSTVSHVAEFCRVIE